MRKRRSGNGAVWLGCGVTLALALAGLAGLYLFGIDSSLFAPVGLFVFILLPVLLGWKVYRLSKVV